MFLRGPVLGGSSESRRWELGICLLGYNLLKHILEVEGIAVHWFRNVYRLHRPPLPEDS
jgi:hypothetical protein